MGLTPPPPTTTTTTPPQPTTTVGTTTTIAPQPTTTIGTTTTTAPLPGVPAAVTNHCSQCHGLVGGSTTITTDDPAYGGQFNLGSSIPVTARSNPADWDSTISRMAGYHQTAGMPISAAELASITDYFSCYWTTNRPSTCTGAPPPPVPPPSNGEVETKAYCGLCHGLVVNGVRVATAPSGHKKTDYKSGAEWGKIVGEMIKEEACPIPGGVGGSTYNLIVKYLTENFSGEKPTSPPGEVVAMCGLCHGTVVQTSDGTKWRVAYPPPGGKDKSTSAKDKSGWASVTSEMIKEQRCPVPGGVGGAAYNTIVDWFYRNFPK